MKKRHWLTAMWPVKEDGSLDPHGSWRCSIFHADNEQELFEQVGIYFPPNGIRSRFWAMEITEDNGFIVTINVSVEKEEA